LAGSGIAASEVTPPQADNSRPLAKIITTHIHKLVGCI